MFQTKSIRIFTLIALSMLQIGVLAMESFEKKLHIPANKFTLDNGLTVIVHEDHKAPLVSVSVWYGVGSKDEVYTQKGLAHLIEHLLFQGSKHHNTDYIESVEALGASELNGTTGRDRTNYYQTVPRQALDRILWMEADRMGYFTESITQEKLNEQLGVVINELKQGDNQPYGLVWKNIIHHTFPKGHPYSWRTIGDEKDLKTVTLKDVKNWFNTHYGAGNATLVLSGAITLEEAQKKTEKYFGHLASGSPVTTAQKWIPHLEHDQRVEMEDNVPQERFYRVWNIPGLGELEAEELNLAAEILSMGKKSRLYQRLVYRDELATNLSAFTWLSQLSGQFIIQATAKQHGSLEKIEKAIEEELELFFRYGPTKDELDRVKAQHKAQFIHNLESIGVGSGKAKLLAEGHLYYKDIHAYKKVFKTKQNADSGSLRETTAEWLENPSFTLYVKTHKNSKLNTKNTITTPPLITEPKPLVLPDEESFKLKNGLKITFIEHHTVPLLRFSLVTPMGFSKDPEKKKGLSKLTMDMIDEGTKKRDLFTISEEVERIGARIGIQTGLDESTISIGTLTENLDKALDIYSDIIINPIFPKNELHRIQELQLATISQENAKPISMAMRLIPILLYGNHPYATPFTGTGYKEDVKNIEKSDIEAHYNTWIKPENCHLFVIGDIHIDKLKQKLERYFGKWKSGKEVTKDIALPQVSSTPKIVLINKPNSTQSVIMAGRLVPPLGEISEIELETFDNILGGTFSSRINMNLREDKHWTYGAHTYLPDANGQRPYIAYSQVQEDKTIDAMKEMAREFSEIIKEKPITIEELAKAKANQIQSLPGILETQSKLISTIMRLYTSNIPNDFYDTYQEKIENLETKTLTKLGNELFNNSPWTWVIVGNANKLKKDLNDLGWGTVEEYRD